MPKHGNLPRRDIGPAAGEGAGSGWQWSAARCPWSQPRRPWRRSRCRGRCLSLPGAVGAGRAWGAAAGPADLFSPGQLTPCAPAQSPSRCLQGGKKKKK